MKSQFKYHDGMPTVYEATQLNYWHTGLPNTKLKSLLVFLGLQFKLNCTNDNLINFT